VILLVLVEFLVFSTLLSIMEVLPARLVEHFSDIAGVEFSSSSTTLSPIIISSSKARLDASFDSISTAISSLSLLFDTEVFSMEPLDPLTTEDEGAVNAARLTALTSPSLECNGNSSLATADPKMWAITSLVAAIRSCSNFVSSTVVVSGSVELS